MKTKLITALRLTASAIRNGTFPYKWTEQSSCNCGALFCTLTGKSPVEMTHLIPKAIKNTDPTWSIIAGQYCGISGLPKHSLFRELFGYGLTMQDISDLEYLKNEKVVAAVAAGRSWLAGLFALSHTDKKDVADYMTAWADILTEEGKLDSAPHKQEQPLEHEHVVNQA